MSFLNADVPHWYCLMRREYLFDLKAHHGEFEPVAVFGIASIPSRALMFHAMTERGACIFRLPLSAFVHKADAPDIPLDHLELWDCFSEQVSVQAFAYLRGLRARVFLKDRSLHWGTYQFTVDWTGSPYADDPGEGGTKCFAGGSLVLTARGWVPIEEVVVGDMVLTHRRRWRPVLRTSQRYERALRLAGFGHPGLTTSADHLFLTQHGWVKAGRLREWATPTEVEPLPVPECPLPLTVELCRFLGCWLGDGTMDLAQKKGRKLGTTRGIVLLTSGPSEKEQARVKETIEAAGFNHRQYKVRTGWIYPVYRKPFCQWILREFGRYSHGKTIPPWVFGLSHEQRAAVLRGYLEADGCTKGPCEWEATSVSKRLALGVKMLAQTLGYSCAFYAQHRKPGTIEGRPTSARDPWNVRGNFWGPNQKLQSTPGPGVMYARVKSREDLGLELPMYDLSVDEDTSYVVEGIIAHNCAHIIALDNGCYAAQPNNRIFWSEPSFITKPFKNDERPDYVTNSHVWRVESVGKWHTEDSDRVFYEVAGEAQESAPRAVSRETREHVR